MTTYAFERKPLSQKIQNGLYFMHAQMGLKMPYGSQSGNYPANTEAEWEAVQWNPPPTNSFETGEPYPSEPDPNADPKPTFEQIMDAYYQNGIGRVAGARAGQTRRRAKELRDEYASTPIRHAPSNSSVEAHPMERLANIEAQVRHIHSNPGKEWVEVEMRDVNNQRITFHTHAEADAYLEAIIHQTNVLHNVEERIIDEMNALEAEAEDLVNTSAERRRNLLERAEKISADPDYYRQKFADALAGLDLVIPETRGTAYAACAAELETKAAERNQMLAGGTSRMMLDIGQVDSTSFKDALARVAALLHRGLLTMQEIRDDRTITDEAVISERIREECKDWKDRIGAVEVVLQAPQVEDTDVSLEVGREGERIIKVTPRRLPDGEPEISVYVTFVWPDNRHEVRVKNAVVGAEDRQVSIRLIPESGNVEVHWVTPYGESEPIAFRYGD